MKVDVVGISNFKSKNGNDCTVIHYNYSNPRVSGMACDTVFVPQTLINTLGVPGLGMYDFSFNRQGFLDHFEKVK